MFKTRGGVNGRLKNVKKTDDLVLLSVPDKSTYIPPAMRRAAQAREQSTERCPEVSPGTVAALKSMLEKELPQVTRGKGDGEEKGPKPQSYGTKKVNDWFARNEAVRLKEQAGLQGTKQ